MPDTTIVVNNFYSYPIVWDWPTRPYPDAGFVKSCTSVLKRKLVTFSISDLISSSAAKEIEKLEYSLKTYPNPFAGNATIEFALDKRQMVKLVILNSLGQQVTVIANREFSTGTHQLVFDSKGLPDGIYIGSLQIPNGSKTIKLIKSSGLN